MRTVELFSGTKSASKVFAEHGHSTMTIDISPRFKPDICSDVRSLTWSREGQIDLLWASPPCEGFSVAAIGKSWNKDNTPKSDTARLAVELVESTLSLIAKWQPTWYFIENPRAKLRKLPLLQHLIHHEISYCQYGGRYMKPTDIWTNAPWWAPRPICKNGAPCHVRAPRGSTTGTQGNGDYFDKGVIPPALFEEILSQMP